VPSTLVHLGVAALVGTALLGPAVDRRALAVVVAVAALPDLDAVAGLVLPGAHRALLHTLLLPALVGALVAADGRRRPEASLVRRRLGPAGPRIAWVAVATLLVGGILPDLATNGVNALYPLHDRFYTVDGRALLSTERGFVQTFVEFDAPAEPPTTANTHYRTGVDPTPGPEPAGVERIFPLAWSGTRLLLVVAGFGTALVRLADARREG
jgi:hypothetical protein